MEKEKKNKIYLKWWFWLIVLVIILIIILIVSNMLKPKFKIKNFEITKDITEYSSIDDTITYDGEGEVVTKNKNGTYLVFVKKILEEGGNQDTVYYDFEENGKKCTIQTVIVHEGEGKISTYDYGKVGVVDRPEYEFEILGYLKIKN